MPYIDGFIAAVPTANKEKYLEHAKLTSVVLKDHSGFCQIGRDFAHDFFAGMFLLCFFVSIFMT